MISKPTVDLLSSPFLSKYIQSKSNKPSFGSLRNQTPIKFSASNTHSLFLNELNNLYGFGSNSKEQISSKKLKLFVFPTRFDRINNDTKVLDFACGDDFSVVLTENQELNIFGCINTNIKNPNIRGLSAANKSFAFAYQLLNVYVGTIDDKNKINNQTYELPVPILMTALNDSIISALGQDGNVYFTEIGNSMMKKMELSQSSEKNPHVKLISAAHDSLTMICDHCVYVYQHDKLTSHYFPSNFNAVYACSSFNDVFALNQNGQVSHCTIKETEMNLHSRKFESIQSCNFDRFESISHISLNSKSAIFLNGNPNYYQYEYIPLFSPISANTHVENCYIKSDFLCCTDKSAYFSTLTIPYSHLASMLSINYVEGACYYTASQRPIQIVDDAKFLKSLYLSKGDIITVRAEQPKTQKQHRKHRPIKLRENEGPQFEIVGVAEGHPWARPINSQYVVALPNNLEQLINQFVIPYETNSLMKHMKINGRHIYVDINPESADLYGYCIGDLLWHPLHGVVEVVGFYCGDLILLEFCERTLLRSDKGVQLKILRRYYPRPYRRSKHKKDKTEKDEQIKVPEQCLHCTRDVVDSNGQVISLDITSGPFIPIFLPMDRVMSPFGEATLLGFHDAPYIQTDQMRMNGYEAISCNILDLKLIRRINAVAKRSVKVLTDQNTLIDVKVSLNTEDSPNQLMPGDKIHIDDKYATIIGFAKDKYSNSEEKDKKTSKRPLTVIRFKGEENCQFLPDGYTLIYRADINGFQNMNINIGSPLIPESLYLPGDTVFQKDLGKCVFLGFNENFCIFTSVPSGEIITLGFSVLLIPDFFEVLDRPVLDFWKTK